jgi:two-component system sensor histidine kinase KdpD
VAAERTRSALLSTVSHDLRTPLASIAGASTALLAPGSLEEEGREDLLRMIADEARRLSRLVENLLQMTRLESGALELQREWLPVDEVVGGALSRMEPALQGRPVDTAMPEESALVAVDGLLLEQALVNLVDNAVRNSPAGSPIEVRVAGVGGPQLEIAVADRGTGVEPGEEDLIFQKFYRGRKGTGTGLGLAICRAVAETHGGTIAARNRPGGGLEVTLRLPLSGSAPEAS